jgi:hypothetical protein
MNKEKRTANKTEKREKEERSRSSAGEKPAGGRELRELREFLCWYRDFALKRWEKGAGAREQNRKTRKAAMPPMNS